MDPLKKLIKNIPGLKTGTELEPITYLETPFPIFNNLTGGGFPRKRYTIIAGPSSVAKTTLALQTIAYQQSIDPEFIALYVDIEHALDKDWVEKLGVDLSRLLILEYKPKKAKEDEEQFIDDEDADTMEWYTQNIIQILEQNIVHMVIIDSIGALMPKQEHKKDMDEETMMVLPKKLNLFFRKATPILARSQTAFIWIGHVYTVPSQHVSFDKVKGGNGVAYYSTLKLIQRRGGKDDTPDKIDVMCPDGTKRKIAPGWGCRIKLDKSKVNDKESQEIVIPFYFGRGLDAKRPAILSALVSLATKKGAWITSDFILDEEGNPGGTVQGKDKFVEYFLENEAQYKLLMEALNKESAELANSAVDSKVNSKLGENQDGRNEDKSW